MISRIRFSRRSVPAALLLLCLLGFGLLSPRLGFYWDDWSSIWFYHRLGPAGVAQSFSVDRPPLGWLFFLTTSLLGESTFAWQIFGILTRWLCCLALWWLLRSLWPQKSIQVTWIALLFAVYPGFKQQPIAVTYSHDWLVMAGFFVSLGLSVWAIRRPRWFWPLLTGSWLLAAYALFADEYYFGLELLRPLFLWMALGGVVLDRKKRLARTLLYWLPFLLLVLAFLAWRLFIHVSPRGQVGIFDLLQTNPLAGVLALATTVLKDVLESSLGAWGSVFLPPNVDEIGLIFTTIAVLLAVGGIFLSWFYLSRLHIEPETDIPPVLPGALDGRAWAWQAILIGALALLVGGIPFWMTDLPITLQFPWDRFTLPMMFGASIFMVGLIELIPGRVRLKVVLVSVLIGLAVGFHLQNGYRYRQEWLAQKDYFWQLAWRVPGLRPGTTLLTADWPFVFYSDFTMSAPVNWIYDPDNTSLEMKYLLYTLESRLGARLKGLGPGVPINQEYRLLNFAGNTSQALSIYYEPPACLRLLDPETDRFIPKQPAYYKDLLPLSNLGQVILQPDTPARPPVHVFGPEPEPDWCYYFQKADLAQQQGDWPKAARLGDLAARFIDHLDRRNAGEFLPFIEGYAMTGKWQEAKEYSMKAMELAPGMQAALCGTWSRVAESSSRPDDPAGKIPAMQIELDCLAP